MQSYINNHNLVLLCCWSTMYSPKRPVVTVWSST